MAFLHTRSHDYSSLINHESTQKYNNSTQSYQTIDSQIEQIHYISYTIVISTILLCLWTVYNIGIHSIQTIAPIITTLLIVAATLHYTADIVFSKLNTDYH
jgi:hypothetical protein